MQSEGSQTQSGGPISSFRGSKGVQKCKSEGPNPIRRVNRLICEGGKEPIGVQNSIWRGPKPNPRGGGSNWLISEGPKGSRNANRRVQNCNSEGSRSAILIHSANWLIPRVQKGLKRQSRSMDTGLKKPDFTKNPMGRQRGSKKSKN